MCVWCVCSMPLYTQHKRAQASTQRTCEAVHDVYSLIRTFKHLIWLNKGLFLLQNQSMRGKQK